MELQNHYRYFKNLNTEIIAIAQEEPDPSTLSRVKKFVKNRFPMVADPEKLTQKLIKRYGVYIVDIKGSIRTFFPGTKEARPRIDILLQELAVMQNLEPPQLKKKQGKVTSGSRKSISGSLPGSEVLEIRWMWSHDTIRPGDLLKLAICPVIAPGFHVYSPWEKQMTPFSIQLVLPPGIKLEQQMAYPKAKVIKDQVLKMELSVYKKDIPVSTLRFRVDDNLKPGKIIIRALITYQACDDSICLQPTTIELKIPLIVKNKDQKRQQVYGWKTW